MELSIQERLKDLCVERGLMLEQFAAQTHFSKSALSSYETEDLKDISHYALIKLTKFYEVTNDYSEIPTSSHRRKLRRNKVVRKSPFSSHLKPFNDNLVLSLKSILDKFPKTDILSFIHTDESLHVEGIVLLIRENQSAGRYNFMTKNYTKNLIRKEFMKLLDDKTLDNITVTELAKK